LALVIVMGVLQYTWFWLAPTSFLKYRTSVRVFNRCALLGVCVCVCVTGAPNPRGSRGAARHLRGVGHHGAASRLRGMGPPRRLGAARHLRHGGATTSNLPATSSINCHSFTALHVRFHTAANALPARQALHAFTRLQPVASAAGVPIPRGAAGHIGGTLEEAGRACGPPCSQDPHLQPATAQHLHPPHLRPDAPCAQPACSVSLAHEAHQRPTHLHPASLQGRIPRSPARPACVYMLPRLRPTWVSISVGNEPPPDCVHCEYWHG
jgi:hypothetical protein